MPTEINLSFIKKKRSEKHFTYADMAEALGLKEPEKYYRRESGTYKFQAAELPPLAKKLGIPISKIFK